MMCIFIQTMTYHSSRYKNLKQEHYLYFLLNLTLCLGYQDYKSKHFDIRTKVSLAGKSGWCQTHHHDHHDLDNRKLCSREEEVADKLPTEWEKLLHGSVHCSSHHRHHHTNCDHNHHNQLRMFKNNGKMPTPWNEVVISSSNCKLDSCCIWSPPVVWLV